MQISTGHTFRIEDPRLSSIPRDDLVFLTGTQDQIGAVSHRVQLGNNELADRAARRKQQKASRRRNR